MPPTLCTVKVQTVKPLQRRRPSGKGNDNPLQYLCLENPMDRGVWWATVHGIAKSWTQLSDFTFTLDPHAPWKDQHHLFKKFYLCIFACTGSSLLYAGFLQLWVGSSLQWLLLLWSAGSRHTGFSVGGMWPWLPWGTWSLPGPRI